MNAGLAAKVGNAYEEEYVVWQALRLLDESIDELTWEAPGLDERGIDLWIRELTGDRVAIQCKTRSTDRWTVKRLEDVHVFEHARLHLAERAPNERAARYEFVTNERAHEWEQAIEAARSDRDLEAHRGVVDAIGDGAPPLLERMRLRFLDQESIEENAQTIAMTLVRASDVPLLIDSVRRIMKQGMGQKWSKVSLQRELESLPLEWVDHPSGRRLAETFAMVTREFIENVRRSRLLPRHLDRPEESALASAALSSPPGSLLLVRGAPGSGKSEVLAGLVAPAGLSGAFVLAMSAEMVGTSVLPENVPARLRSLAGETKALLVIDQVDQLARGGTRHQPALRPVVALIDAARRAGIVVVVGCRSLETSRVAQLENLFFSAEPGRRIEIEVDELPEGPVADLLSERGIPLDDLNAELRQMVRRPILLSLLLRLVREEGGWKGVRSQLELVRRWLESLRHDLGEDALAVLDAVAERMDVDGTTSLDRSRLPLPSAIEALVDARVLVLNAAGRVRPFHQVVTDTLLALRVADRATATTLRQWIGDRSSQDLHKARRLRLATSVLAARGPIGVNILASVVQDGSVRPLLKHALLMGLATVEQPSRPLVEWVRTLLSDETRRETIARTVVYDHVAWIDALDADLDRAWEAWPAHRDLLLQLLASVSTKRGERVTELLLRWKEDDPNLLERARLVFWHDPSEDCDSQFELRLQSPWIGPDAYPIDWSVFLRRMPLRAIRLLVESLKRSPRDVLVEGDPGREWMYEWPSPETLPPGALELGRDLLDRLEVWWRELDVSEFQVATLLCHASGEEPLVRAVELLARSVARSIARGEMDWQTVLDWAPRPPRPLDAWLLLRVGACLDDGTSSASADAAASWFEKDDALRRLLVDVPWSPPTAQAARAFLLGVAAHAAPDVATRLRERADQLPRLRKPTSRTLRPVQPSVSLEQSAPWGPAEWSRAFEDADPSDDAWCPGPDGTILDTSVTALASQLSRSALRDPPRFVEFARVFGTASPPLPPAGRRALLEGLTNAHVGDLVESSDLESLLLLPAFRDEPECCSVLARAISDRPDHSWSARLLERLAEIAHDLNDGETARSALRALARVADRQPARRAFALDAIEPLFVAQDPGLRAACVEIAIVARSADPTRAIALVLRAAEDEAVAADAKVAAALRFIACAPSETGEEAARVARERLISLSRNSSEDAARLGGASLLVLLRNDVLSREDFDAVVSEHTVARRGASRTLATWLDQGESRSSSRMKALALAFANDDDLLVRREILRAFLGRGESPLLDDRSFLAGIVRSRAVGDDRSSLLHAFDRRGTLLPLADEVIALSEGLRSPDVPAVDPWMRRHHAERTCAILARLIEEAEREEDLAVRDRALDAWDALLEADVPAALSSLSSLLDGSEDSNVR